MEENSINENKIREEMLRLPDSYEKTQKEHEDIESLAKTIFYTKKALQEGFLPDGFEEELIEYLEICELVKKDMLTQLEVNKKIM